MSNGSFSSISQALKHKITFENERQREIIKAANNGLEFFSRYNESRIDLAFASFSEEMKHALFEVIFFSCFFGSELLTFFVFVLISIPLLFAIWNNVFIVMPVLLFFRHLSNCSLHISCLYSVLNLLTA